MTSTKEYHEISELVPKMTKKEMESLKESIKKNGLRVEITLYEGKILDGRHRYEACLSTGVKPRYTEYTGSDPVGYVEDMNINERQLSDAQIIEYFMNKEKYFKSKKGPLPGSRAPMGALLEREGRTTEKIAKKSGISPRNVQRGKSVREKAPEIWKEALEGDLTIRGAETKMKRKAKAAKAAEAPEKPVKPTIIDEPSKVGIFEEFKKDQFKGEPLTKEQEEAIVASPPNAFNMLYIDPPYHKMTLEEVAALPVPYFASKDAMLFIWCPASHLLQDVLDIVDSWDFKLKDTLVWDRDVIRNGFCTKNLHDFLLICEKGSMPKVSDEDKPESIIVALEYKEYKDTHRGVKVRKHEKGWTKPEEDVYEIIESTYPDTRMISLLTDKVRPGWTRWIESGEMNDEER